MKLRFPLYQSILVVFGSFVKFYVFTFWERNSAQDGLFEAIRKSVKIVQRQTNQQVQFNMKFSDEEEVSSPVEYQIG